MSMTMNMTTKVVLSVTRRGLMTKLRNTFRAFRRKTVSQKFSSNKFQKMKADSAVFQIHSAPAKRIVSKIVTTRIFERELLNGGTALAQCGTRRVCFYQLKMVLYWKLVLEGPCRHSERNTEFNSTCCEAKREEGVACRGRARRRMQTAITEWQQKGNVMHELRFGVASA